MKQLLLDHHLDIIAITESKRDSDHIIHENEIPNGYKWIGKNRSSGKGGGIGFLYNSTSVSIEDDNLIDSRTDTMERLWISVKCLGVSIAIGVVYFSVDNTPNLEQNAQELQNELIQNVSHFKINLQIYY
jgi:hypothetical protein